MSTLSYLLVGGEEEIDKRSSTGATKGKLQVAIKCDNDDNPAQVYSELAANRLAQFLGLSVALGVVARSEENPVDHRFASLWVADHDLDLFDFTEGGRPIHEYEEPPPWAHDTEWYWEFEKLCRYHPVESAQLAVFDLWILNDDRDLNIKGWIKDADFQKIYGVDHGSSLLACGESIKLSIANLSDTQLPRSHPMRGLVDPVQCGGMIERICSLQEWALMAAIVPGEAVGNVLPDAQYELLDVLMERRKHLTDIVNRVLFPPQ